ncbi:tRNA pseudouridine(55) synthase TruB [Candidatus Dependentiae bacterium]|nr:tRNA pseudouridine(55) synthase TruB [Candidatus Dependentiae bacterium]
MQDGCFIVNKQEGYTSFDVVNEIKKKFKLKKAGHTGTLDVMATGVLVVCINNATRLVEYLMENDKDYFVKLRLGYNSDTLDRTGNIEKTGLPENLTDIIIKKTILSFIGKQEQIPPMYSAKKKNGKRLYSLARKGITVEREPQTINIKFIQIEKIERENDYIDVDFFTTVTKGAYIRTLCDDIAKKMGTSGIMQELNRTRVGKFEICKSKKIAELSDNDLIDMESVSDMPLIEVPLAAVPRFMNGNRLSYIELNNNDYSEFLNKTVLVKSKGDIIMGVAKITNNQQSIIEPQKVFK